MYRENPSNPGMSASEAISQAGEGVLGGGSTRARTTRGSVPGIFVPGNGGSYKQVRSIASETARAATAKAEAAAANVLHDDDVLDSDPVSIDWYAVHLNDELGAFHGDLLERQAEFLAHAMRFVSTLYPPGVPTFVYAHSMGGVVARARDRDGVDAVSAADAHVVRVRRDARDARDAARRVPGVDAAVHRAVLFAPGAFYTLVPIRPRSRGGRRSLRTSPVVSLRPPLAFNTRPRRLSTPSDAFQLHPDVRSYGMALRTRTGRASSRCSSAAPRWASRSWPSEAGVATGRSRRRRRAPLARGGRWGATRRRGRRRRRSASTSASSEARTGRCPRTISASCGVIRWCGR